MANLRNNKKSFMEKVYVCSHTIYTDYDSTTYLKMKVYN
jgi:hypothetical protein